LKIKDFLFLNSGNSIHNPNSVRFYEEVLKAGDAVKNILSSGLSLHLIFLKEKIKDWENLGRVKKVSSVPLIVNPLSVAEKLNKDTREIKLRPLLDMSRFINPRIVKHHSHLDNLDYCEP